MLRSHKHFLLTATNLNNLLEPVVMDSRNGPPSTRVRKNNITHHDAFDWHLAAPCRYLSPFGETVIVDDAEIEAHADDAAADTRGTVAPLMPDHLEDVRVA